MLDDLAKILEFESVQSEAAEHAPFGLALKETLEWFLNRAQTYGFAVKNLDGYCGYVEYGTGAELLGILCHLDVVPAGEGWSHSPYKLTEANGFLYGRGVVDNKGPAIVMLHVLKKMKDCGYMPNRRIRLIVGCNEETGCACIDYYTAHAEIPAFSIVPDADFPVINSEKGILQVRLSLPVSQSFSQHIRRVRFGNRANVVPDFAQAELTDGATLETRGRAGHAMCPEQAENAAHKLFQQLAGALEDCETVRKILCNHDGAALGIACADQKSGALTMNLGAGIYDGETDNQFHLTLDFRLPLCIKKEAVLAALKTKFPSAVINVLHAQPNLYLDPDCKLIQAILNVYQTVTGNAATPCQTGGGTYARHLPYAAAFGPTFPDTQTFIHDADERISAKQFQTWFDLYYAALLELDQIQL